MNRDFSLSPLSNRNYLLELTTYSAIRQLFRVDKRIGAVTTVEINVSVVLHGMEVPPEANSGTGETLDLVPARQPRTQPETVQWAVRSACPGGNYPGGKGGCLPSKKKDRFRKTGNLLLLWESHCEKVRHLDLRWERPVPKSLTRVQH
jgi:hypothetical protein